MERVPITKLPLIKKALPNFMKNILPAENILLSREDFKKYAFMRDHETCVFCSLKAVDAHHILDRKLFNDGGYYLGNVASVCEEHHWDCEKTVFTVEMVREKADIQNPVIPCHLDLNKIYDKWGNEILESGMRKKGILFHDDGVQKIFKQQGLLWMFID
jgi:hypothetical protein